MHASLPMNDFAEHAATTDLLWSAVAAHLSDQGIDAPRRLDRSTELDANWLRPDLLVSQTCGLPYVRSLRGKVRLVAGVSYDLPDSLPGTYRSRIIVRAESDAESIADLRGQRVAFNAPESQSGAGAMRHIVLPLTENGRFFSGAIVTGAHFESIRAVASGRADVAAIDDVTFAFAERYVPETKKVRMLCSTDMTPGLPLITANDGPAEAIYEAFTRALDDIGPQARATLMINGLVPRKDDDFDILADWDREARQSGYGT